MRSVFGIAALACAVAFSGSVAAQDQPPETDQQRQMAAQMAAWMDTLWEQAPEAGTANLRFLLVQDGEPLSMPPSIYGAFAFRAERPARGEVITQAFNPNENGRWVYEGLAPGTYHLSVEGRDAFEGWSWTERVTVEAGDAPVFELAPGE